MLLQEVILCATAPQPSASGSGAIVLHDIQTGTSLASFKQSSSAPHCTSFVETCDGQGGIILAAQQDKSILNIYNFQKVAVMLQNRFNLPHPFLGPTRFENCSPREAFVHCARYFGKILCGGNYTRSNISMGGSSQTIMFHVVPRLNF
jgi:hypothetical protein